MHSGLPAEERHRRQGVAIVMREKAALAWRQAGSEFDPVSERILRVRLKSHTGFLSLIAVYAPTNEPMKEEKSLAFYQALQECGAGS